METEQRKRVMQLVEEALDRDGEARAAFLAEACAGDEALRNEVEELLAADAEAGSFLASAASPAGEVTLTAGAPTSRRGAVPSMPEQVGQYKLVREIDSGGMGTVYEAIQERTNQTVAVKVIRRGMVSRGLLKRFEYESRMLGRLQHPGIAQVYEAGIHRDGDGALPYFAMEYIPHAASLTEYANRKKLGTRQRLELFATVCDAVHHGHQKGVIHRDLKPSNILVDDAGHAKIIDFGVARSTDSDVAVTTMQTDVGQLIGTLQYMSPEQCLADPHDIDTRSDVYALGVVMFELLCGRMPYDVKGQPIHEVTRTIREQPPTRLSTVNRTLRGDVETIALKALEKERERRYQSAADLATDIRRYLKSEPISARPPSMAYHVRVFARRNKALVGAVAAVFVILVGATVVSTRQYFKAEEAREVAVAERNAAEAAREEEAKTAKTAKDIRDFYLGTLRSLGDNIQAGRNVDARGVLDAYAQWILSGALKDELANATVRTALAWELVLLDDTETADALLEPALATRLEQFGENHWDTLRCLQVKGRILVAQGKIDEGIRVLRQSIEGRWELERNGAEGVHSGKIRFQEKYLCGVLSEQQRFAELEAFVREVYAVRRRMFGDSWDLLALPTIYLSEAQEKQGRFDEVETVLREALDVTRQADGEKSYNTRWAASELRDALIAHGKIEEARPLTIEVLAIGEHLSGLPVAKPRELKAHAEELLTCVPEDLRDPVAALAIAKRAVEITEGKRPSLLATLAMAQFETGDAAAAVETQKKAVALLGPGDDEIRPELEKNLEKYRNAVQPAAADRVQAEGTDGAHDQ